MSADIEQVEGPASQACSARKGHHVNGSPRDLAARDWFGYGRWDASYWFIGMEPGGTDDHASYESWLQLGGSELIDCRAHHLNPQHPGWAKWHTGSRPPTQPTWRCLIQLLLSFKGESTDLDAVRTYQRDEWGSTHGETAVLELGALHAPGLDSHVDRQTFRDTRIERLRGRLTEYQPIFVACYGRKFQDQFQRIIDGKFDHDGFAWSRSTLCVMLPGPTSHLRGKPTPWVKPEWWTMKGLSMRNLLESR